jgi:hypothetical protein
MLKGFSHDSLFYHDKKQIISNDSIQFVIGMVPTLSKLTAQNINK